MNTFPPVAVINACNESTTLITLLVIFAAPVGESFICNRKFLVSLSGMVCVVVRVSVYALPVVINDPVLPVANNELAALPTVL